MPCSPDEPFLAGGEGLLKRSPEAVGYVGFVAGQPLHRVVQPSVVVLRQDRHRGLSLRLVSGAVFRRGGPPWLPVFMTKIRQ